MNLGNYFRPCFFQVDLNGTNMKLVYYLARAFFIKKLHNSGTILKLDWFLLFEKKERMTLVEL